MKKNASAPRQGDRRTLICQAGLTLVAQAGVRGLTHRAVDRKLSLAIGSTSYYYRRQKDLLSAVTEYMVSLDLNDFEPCSRLLAQAPVDSEALLNALVDLMVHFQQPELQERAAARIELLMAAQRDPQIEAIFSRLWASQAEINLTVLAALGSDDGRDVTISYRALFSGLMLHAAIASLGLYPAIAREELAVTLRRMLGWRVESIGDEALLVKRKG